MKENIHIKQLDLGHGVIIENDELKSLVQENQSSDDALELDDAFAEIMEMAEKIDKYYEDNSIQVQ